MKYSMSGSQGEETGSGSKAISFSTMNRKIKQAKNGDKHFLVIKERNQEFSGSGEHELKTFLGTRGFINGEQGIKTKRIKGSLEHVPLGGAHLKCN